MDHDNGGFLQLTVNGFGEFMLGDNRLAELTAGVIGAVFDVRLHDPEHEIETRILRVTHQTPFKSNKVDDTEIMTVCPIERGTGKSRSIRVSDWPDDIGWHLRFNTELTEEHLGDAETRQTAMKRLRELKDKRNDHAEQMNRVIRQEGELKRKFGLDVHPWNKRHW